MERIKSAGLTLNKEKCEFSQEEVSFLGQVVGKSGVRPDPNTVKAIVDMKEPTDWSELRRFLGMVNQLGKFSRHVAEICKPLRDLLSQKREWVWDSAQKQPFRALKKELSNPDRLLAHYDPAAETVVSVDASSWLLVQFSYKSSTKTEAGDRWPLRCRKAVCTYRKGGISSHMGL